MPFPSLTPAQKALYGGLAVCFALAAGVYTVRSLDAPASPEVKAVRQDVRALLPLTRQLINAVPDDRLPVSLFIDPDKVFAAADAIGKETNLSRACGTLSKLHLLHKSTVFTYLAQYPTGDGPLDIRVHTRTLTDLGPGAKACARPQLR